MRYRKIMCPDAVDGVLYELSNPQTGEIMQSADVAALLKYVAGTPEHPWHWRTVPQTKVLDDS